jgi:hypothetical protein
MWAKMAAKSAIPLWAATPNEEESGGRVAHNARVLGGPFVPSEGPFAFPDYHVEISLAFRTQTGREVCVRLRVAPSASNKEYPSEHFDRVLGQVGLSQKSDAQLVVAHNVPTVQGVLIAQVRDELCHGHASSCPWDDTLGIHLEHVGHQPAHSLFFCIEANEKIGMAHRLERGFAFFKAPGLWDGGTLKEWVEMAIHFYRNACDMCGDLVGRPSIARTDSARVTFIDRRQKCLCFGTSLDHIDAQGDKFTWPIYRASFRVALPRLALRYVSPIPTEGP